MEFGSGTLNGIMATETFFVNGMEIPETLFIEITKEKGDVFEDVIYFLLYFSIFKKLKNNL